MSRWTEWTPEICDKAIDLAAMGIAFKVEARTRGDAARLRVLLIDRIVDRGIGARVDPPDEYGNVTAKVYGSGEDGTITITVRDADDGEWTYDRAVNRATLPRTSCA